MMHQPIHIINGLRSPFSKMGTDLATIHPVNLGAQTVQQLLAQTGIPSSSIDEVIVGSVCQPIDAANLARQIALAANIPQHVPAVTVHRNCASGMEAITYAMDKIAAKRGDIYLVGGIDVMSQTPWLYSKSSIAGFMQLNKAKSLGQKVQALRTFPWNELMRPQLGLKQGLTDPSCALNMGQTAQLLADQYHIDFETQNAFAQLSHEKAHSAQEQGYLAEEICPIYIAQAGETITLDNGIRAHSSLAKLNQLQPVFKNTTTITAGNSSQITDGACFLIIASEKAKKRYQLDSLGILNDYAYAGCSPKHMGLGPLYALHQLIQQSSIDLTVIDILEINEAFAAQILSVLECLSSSNLLEELGLSKELLNLSKFNSSHPYLNALGGAIALGHPVGASGARLILTCLKQLQRNQQHQAIATLCVGGGQGAALWLQTPD